MSPRDAAKAFYGQDEAAFSEMIKKLAVNDPRLVAVFKKTRERIIQDKKS